MNTGSLNPGDLIRCNVRGLKFEATYRGPIGGRRSHYITPIRSTITYRSVTARQIEEKLKRQEKLGV